MRSNGRHRAPRGLVALVAAVTVVPLAVFLWLGARLLDQDRQLEQQQARDRLQTAADLVAATLQRAIASSEQRLVAGAGDWPDGAVAATFSADGIVAEPRGRLAYLPVLPALRSVPTEPFRTAEALEFQKLDRHGAIAVYRKLALSSDHAVRSGALIRLARNLDAIGRHDEALATYAGLQETADVVEAGVPLGLSASWARCTILERLHRSAELSAAASRFRGDLATGRWPVLEPAYVTYAADADRWAGRPSATPRGEIFSAAISTLWRERTDSLTEPRSRRRSITIENEDLVAIRQSAPPNVRVLIASRPFVESAWLQPVTAVAAAQAVDVELRDGSGRMIPLGGALRSRESRAALLTTTVNGAQADLPWNLTIASASMPGTAAMIERRRLLLAGFALLALLSAAAGWLIVRAVTREVAVARLQSDFVAAVSHEFRTPLTTLRQFTEMLREQPGLDLERRRLCYDAQTRATDRLAHLVESVLDFGRMEAGAHPYRFKPGDCAELVQRVVDDFRVQPHAAGYHVDFQRNGSIPIEADAEALSRALWNLLDNAVKYSPDRGPIRVGLVRNSEQVVISVSDSGLGIPAREQQSIFGKFQRGEAARQRGIRGTGIGLAMVDQIVRAHGGRVGVESDPGAGSTFTIVLPLKA